MTQTKTKPILLTIAALVALAFVAGMVLHKHEEPKIIGKLSPEDVRDISKVIFAVKRMGFELDAKYNIEHVKIGALTQSIGEYFGGKITSLERLTNGEVLVTIGTKTNEYFDEWRLAKEEDGWVLAPRPRPVPIPMRQVTNTAPVSQPSIGR